MGFYILVFTLKFLEMALYSARMAFLISGQKKSASFTSIFEVAAWAFGTGAVAMTLFTDLYVLVPYLLGSQIGILVGMYIENIISKRDTVLIVITNELCCVNTIHELATNNFGVTTLESEDNTKILLIATKKLRINKAKKILKQFNHNQIVITTAASKAVGGYIY